jgi:hypothetical protein
MSSSSILFVHKSFLTIFSHSTFADDTKNIELRTELKRLKTDNFVLQQKVEQEKIKLRDATRTSAELARYESPPCLDFQTFELPHFLSGGATPPSRFFKSPFVDI